MTGPDGYFQVEQQDAADHAGRKLVLKFKGARVKKLLAGKHKGLDSSNNSPEEKKEHTPPEEEEEEEHPHPTTARPHHPPLGPPAGSSPFLGSRVSGKRHKSQSLAYLASTVPPIEVEKSYNSPPLMLPQDTATAATATAMLAVNRSGDVPAPSPFAAHTQQQQQQRGTAIVRKRVPAPHATAKLLAAQRQQQDEYNAPPPPPPILQHSQYHHPKKHAVPGSSNGQGTTTTNFNATTTVHKPGSLVWIKLGSYPWWPGQVQHPTTDQKRLKHNQEEDVFVVFYGSKDYCWVPSMDVKPFSKVLPEYTKFAGVKNNKLQRAIDDAWVAGMGRIRPDVAGRPYD